MSEAAAPVAPANDQPAPKKKFGLWEMLVYLDSEIGRIDIWERVLNSEGEPLYPAMAGHRRALTGIRATIELVMAHEKDFVALVKSKKGG